MHYNIVILGDYYVGKSSIISRIINKSFDSNTYPTIGTSYFSKEINLNHTDKILRFSIWDTAGQERFRSFVTFYLKKPHIIYLCYDITVSQTFNNLKQWMNTINQYIKLDKYLGILIATKSDLKSFRQISYEEGQKYADSINFFFYETSSKTNSNIDTLFDFTIDTFIKQNKEKIENDEIENNKQINLKKNNYLVYC